MHSFFNWAKKFVVQSLLSRQICEFRARSELRAYALNNKSEPRTFLNLKEAIADIKIEKAASTGYEYQLQVENKNAKY
ncbi:MAG: hypothetical protein DWQ05_21530 [Calditrichaeota bacterium]|nr:MAG: hypothetical protein DWQ05_21530 [Calditrichota bacterium]